MVDAGALNARQVSPTGKHALTFKVGHGLLIAFFTFITLLHILGIYLFTSGFLLTRLVLDQKTSCANPPVTVRNDFAIGDIEKGCWHPKSFDKAVVLIIDALRYDFTIPFQTQKHDPEPHHFHNAIPLLYDTAIASPNNAVLLPFIADPPTTTLQRLKGLTTGTLPTFIDAGSNFAGTAIDEDNLVAKLKDAGKVAVQLGDDTWQSLFPGLFDANLTRPYDSFNVWDLHTVDNGVIEHLMPLLHPSNTSRWDVIFGHFLGVDHAGHRYGPDHPAMTSKLHQMDTLLRQVMNTIDDRTLLIVMGDHGMDAKGDHGGESDDEVEAALWMYSKTAHFGRVSTDAVLPPPSAKVRPVNQIDLVPTLALLLGLPIPFNNLGAPITEAFIGRSSKDFENLATVNRLSSALTRQYQEQYALVRKPDAEALRPAAAAWNFAVQSWESRTSLAKTLSGSDWHQLAEAFSSFQKANLKMSKDLWARFDPINMVIGITTSAMVLLFVLLFAVSLSREKTAFSTALLARGSIAMTAGALLGSAAALAFPSLGTLRGIFASAISAAACLLFQVFWSVRSTLLKIFPTSITGWLCIIPALLISVGFASNSFTIWEDEILLFFLGITGCILFAMSLRIEAARNRKIALINSIVFLIFIRLASLSRLCREEQMPICKSTFYSSNTSSTSAPWQLGISYLVAIFLPSTIENFFIRTQSYSGSAVFWIGIVFRSCLFMIAAYWTLDAADDGDWLPQTPEGLLKTVRVYTAQLVLVIATGAGLATFTVSSLFFKVDSINRSDGTTSPASKPRRTTIATAQSAPHIIIAGASNIYGSHFTLLSLTILLIPLLLVQKPMGQGALALTVTSILSLIDTLHLLSPQTSSLHTKFAPVILALLANFAYFKTGHQATLASIQWDVAFIPTHTVKYPWSPLMVILNHFGAQILCAACVPACVLWRRGYRFSESSKPTTISDQSGREFTVLTPTTSSSSSSSNDDSFQSASKQEEKREEDIKFREQNRREYERKLLLSDVATALAAHFAVYALINTATSIWAAHLRRHLMLYRIFSPRWMMGCAALIIAEVAGVWIGLGGVRWSVISVADVFGW